MLSGLPSDSGSHHFKGKTHALRENHNARRPDHVSAAFGPACRGDTGNGERAVSDSGRRDDRQPGKQPAGAWSHPARNRYHREVVAGDRVKDRPRLAAPSPGKFLYRPEHLDFLRDGFRQMSLAELVEAFNRHFGLDRSFKSIIDNARLALDAQKALGDSVRSLPAMIGIESKDDA